ncbi:NAD-dependent epimerase/dehydratase family protein [Olivibacter sp. SDN3]|uniref:NAD-dependent epimerase/dehydratase family protein n=1 Tax=Olivibacter sp. SDN3 TaxID=2764720 RepID=UPI00210479A9|nr:NAD-dependent epimerase/dehydratase family protein [Olivibacter sp. SDN3]
MIHTLLTGYTGFVGKNLITYFNDDQVVSVSNLNLRDVLPPQLPKASALIHLAGKAHDLKNASDAEVYFKVNTELTKALFDRFLISDVRDFIYFSSVKAVADTVHGVLEEDVVPSPITP